jgi:hypothetical protein
MTTLQSQSLTLSLKDSALNPANTAEWTAPILAQARKAAVACHVIGRLGVSSVPGIRSLSSSSVTFADFGKEDRRKEGRRKNEKLVLHDFVGALARLTRLKQHPPS